MSYIWNGIQPRTRGGAPPQPRWLIGMQETSTNFSDLNVGVSSYELNGPTGTHRRVICQKGYGIDLDGDGKFDGSKDGILAFDINGDGRIDAGEIAESQRRLKLLTESPRRFHHGDKEAAKREAERRQLLRQYDKNNDGHLDASELHAAGGKILVDSNKDGVFSANEAQGFFRIKTDAGTFQFDSMSLGVEDAFMRPARPGGRSKISRVFDNPHYDPDRRDPYQDLFLSWLRTRGRSDGSTAHGNRKVKISIHHLRGTRRPQEQHLSANREA